MSGALDNPAERSPGSGRVMASQGVAGHLLSVITAPVPVPAPWGHTGSVAGQTGALQTPAGGTDTSKSSGLCMLDLFQGW